MRRLCPTSPATFAEVADVLRDHRDEHDGVGHEEESEDRSDRRHGLLDPAQVENEQDPEADERERELPLVPRRGKEAADGVGARGERDRDREDVVDEQRGARENADGLAEQLARDDVSAAARREMLDDAAVARADDRGP